MKRDEAISQLRKARKELLDSIAGMSDEDFLRPKAVGKWTVKDVLAHIASWDEEVVRVLQAFAMQSEPQFSYTISNRNGFAVWNEEQVAMRRDRSLAEVMQEFEKARRDLIQVLEGLTDPVLSRPKMTSWGKIATGFELVTVQMDHDLEHASQIRSYRKKIERWARARQRLSEKRKAKKA